MDIWRRSSVFSGRQRKRIIGRSLPKGTTTMMTQRLTSHPFPTTVTFKIHRRIHYGYELLFWYVIGRKLLKRRTHLHLDRMMRRRFTSSFQFTKKGASWSSLPKFWYPMEYSEHDILHPDPREYLLELERKREIFRETAERSSESFEVGRISDETSHDRTFKFSSFSPWELYKRQTGGVPG